MSPKPDADDPRIGAPSPADNPTIPARAVADEDAPGTDPERPERRGSTGPADAPTRPAGPRPDGAAGATPRARVTPGRTRTSMTWVGLILGAVVLIFLLIFIVQNNRPAEVTFLGLQGTLPLGIWLLFAAVAGVLLLAIPGLGRLLQWRKATGRSRSGARR